MTDFDPQIGVAEQITPDIARITAPNPSPMTFRGTNTYLLGQEQIAVIDPGPDSQAHLDAILNAIGQGSRITHIFVTHAHLDHSPLAQKLSQITRAPVYAYGPAKAGQSAIMQELEQSSAVSGGEGIDHSFIPDLTLHDGQTLSTSDWEITAIHTPGHMANHMCFQFGDILFTGDHIMGWATSMVSPPDGDLTQFMASCERLAKRSWGLLLPGHGDQVKDANARIEWLISHRKTREAQILDNLANRSGSAQEIAQRIYTDISPKLLPAATRNVLAHCIDLSVKGLITFDKPLQTNSIFKKI